MEKLVCCKREAVAARWQRGTVIFKQRPRPAEPGPSEKAGKILAPCDLGGANLWRIWRHGSSVAGEPAVGSADSSAVAFS